LMPETLVGARFAGFEVERLLGRGGMGVVYLAQHLALDRKVALKVLTAELGADQDFRDRFIREARLAAQIDHPNVIPVYDAGLEGGLLYIAMRYVDGTDLRAVIDAEQALSTGRTVQIVSQVGQALQAAHDKGLVHRDVKPANILLEPRTSGERVFLSDFGLTKRVDSASRMTKAGMFVGTVSYAAPEQLQAGPVDQRADIYALGCLLYECLTGAPPFAAETEAQVMVAHLMQPPPLVSQRRPDVGALDGVVIRAMAKEPNDRYQSCVAFLDDVRDTLASGGSPAPEITVPARLLPAPGPFPPLPAPPPGRKHRGLVVGLAAFIVTLAAVFFVVRIVGTSSSPRDGKSSGPSASSSASSRVNARDVPVSSLLRPATEAVQVEYGDLDGDGIEEIVLLSQAKNARTPGKSAQFLDVFAYTGKKFDDIFDATGSAPPGAVAAPPEIIAPSDRGFESDAVVFMRLVDFQQDDTPEIVAGVMSFGAGNGPLDVWVLSMQQGVGLHTDFFEGTTNGGDLFVTGAKLHLKTGVFKGRDPLCCPSEEEHQVIGYSPVRDRIEVLSRTVRPLST
jgi:serine/threonine protein kinase